MEKKRIRHESRLMAINSWRLVLPSARLAQSIWMEAIAHKLRLSPLMRMRCGNGFTTRVCKYYSSCGSCRYERETEGKPENDEALHLR